MSRRFAAVSSYFPLVLTILFGLILSLLPISSALGSNVGACQGTTTTAKISFGGRVMTPTLILRASNNQPCAANETSLSLVSLSRTIIVSPNGTPTQNGNALMAARDLIASANPPASASNPYLLKLEPGNYDLGNQSLSLLPYVDLEGSGEGTTVISSSNSTGTYPPSGVVAAASNSEIRDLKVVASNSSNNYQAGIVIPTGATNVRVSHVTSSATTGLQSFGIINNNGNAIVTDSTFSASATTISYGLLNDNGGTIKVVNSTLSATGAGQSYALYSLGGTSTVNNSSLSASGTYQNFAFQINNGGNCTVTNSTFNSTGGSNANYGLLNNGLNCTIGNSTLRTSGGPESYSLYNGNTATSTVTNSTLSASATTTGYGIFRNGGTAQAFNSLLSGSTFATTGMSGTDCTYSINATTHAPLDASCH